MYTVSSYGCDSTSYVATGGEIWISQIVYL